MRTSQTLVIVVILVLLGIFAFMWSGKKPVVENTPPIIPTEQVVSIKGCYTAVIASDVYTLNIQTQEGSNVSGRLAFKNFEKDSSTGTFVGTYQDGILLGDYSFQSEGMNSVMQVIFKKSGNDFVRGYGDVDKDGTRFTNLNNITYNPSSPLSLFKKGECR